MARTKALWERYSSGTSELFPLYKSSSADECRCNNVLWISEGSYGGDRMQQD